MSAPIKQCQFDSKPSEAIEPLEDTVEKTKYIPVNNTFIIDKTEAAINYAISAINYIWEAMDKPITAIFHPKQTYYNIKEELQEKYGDPCPQTE